MDIRQILKNNKVIMQNAGYLSAIEVMRLILPFIALPYVIRTIGVENYGTVAFAQTVITYFVIFINFGMDVSAVKDVAEHRHEAEKLNRVVSSVLVVKSVLLLVAFLALLAGMSFVPYLREERLLYFFVFLSCLSEILFPIWFYQGIEKMKYLTIIRFTSICFYTMTVFVFVRSADDYVYVALLQSVGCILSGGLSLYFLLKVEHVRLLLPTCAELKSCFLDSIPFFVSRFSVVVNNGIAKLLSGIFLTMEAVAAFDIAQKMANIALIPMQMMNQAVYPHIADTKSLSFVNKYLRVDVLLSLSVAAAVFLIAPYAVCYFMGAPHGEATTVLRILCLWIFFGGITIYIGAPVLVSFGHPRPFNHSVILSTLSLLLAYLTYYLTDSFNIYNFACALVLSEFVILVYRFYYCIKLKLFVL